MNQGQRCNTKQPETAGCGWTIVIPCIPLVLLTIVTVSRLITHSAPATVISRSWFREVVIERKTTVIEEGPVIPDGGRLISQRGPEQLIIQSVQFSMPLDPGCEETIYRYMIERWVECRSIPTEGVDEPYWPIIELASATGPRGVGAERISRKLARYTVVFARQDADEAGFEAINVPFEFWRHCVPGNPVTVVTDLSGRTVKLEPFVRD